MSHIPIKTIHSPYGIMVSKSYAQPSFRGIGLGGVIDCVLRSKENNAPLREDAHLSTRHHWVFVDWAEGIAEGRIKPGSIMVQFDEHQDLHSPSVPVPVMLKEKLTPQRAVELASGFILDLEHEDRCPETSYVAPAVVLGWIGEIYRVVPDGEYRQVDIHYEITRHTNSISIFMIDSPEKSTGEGKEVVTVKTHIVPIDQFAKIFMNPEGKTVFANVDCDFWNLLLKKSPQQDFSAVILASMRELKPKIFDVARPVLHTIATEPGYCRFSVSNHPLLINEYLKANPQA